MRTGKIVEITSNFVTIQPDSSHRTQFIWKRHCYANPQVGDKVQFVLKNEADGTESYNRIVEIHRAGR